MQIPIVAGAFGFSRLVYTLAERWLPMDELHQGMAQECRSETV